MNKRGQFYLIIAIIFSFAIFIITAKNNKVEETVLFEDFSHVSQNYATEAPKVVNYALYGDFNVNSVLRSFTEDFLGVYRKTNPSLSLLYIYSNTTNITVTSYLDQTTILETNSSADLQPLFGAQEVSINDVTLNVAGINFVHHVPVEIKNFGDSFNTQTLNPTQYLRLNIGGIFHTFKLETTSPQLQLLITSQNQKTVRFYTVGQEGLPSPIKS